MPSTLFDSAGLAIVAYAEVMADGTTEIGDVLTANSGVTTTKTGTGQYSLFLNSGKTQNQTRIMALATPNGVVDSVPASIKVEIDQVPDVNGNQAIKIGTYSGSPLATFADSDFSILILRTIIPS